MKPRYWQILWLGLVALFIFIGVRPHEEPPPPGHADLIVHATINLVLGLLAFRAFSFPRPYMLVLVGLVAVGGSIELLQSFSPNREPAVSDFAANLFGIAVAAVLAKLLHSRREV